jgi:hypothetical protein
MGMRSCNLATGPSASLVMIAQDSITFAVGRHGSIPDSGKGEGLPIALDQERGLHLALSLTFVEAVHDDQAPSGAKGRTVGRRLDYGLHL